MPAKGQRSARNQIEICPDCGRKPKGRVIAGKCSGCYESTRRGVEKKWPTLDPEFQELLLSVSGTNHTFARRVFAYVDASGDCWEWTGAKDEAGYGIIGKGGRRGGYFRAHSAVWQLLVGAIPDGMVYDHLCRNHSCVNPDHGEIVPPGENTKRGYGASFSLGARTVCSYGHPLDGIRKNRNKRVRYCKTCRREKQAAKYVPKARYFDADRAREVITRYKSGERPADIARAMDISLNVAKRIARDWRNGGYQSLGIAVAETPQAA